MSDQAQAVEKSGLLIRDVVILENLRTDPVVSHVASVPIDGQRCGHTVVKQWPMRDVLSHFDMGHIHDHGAKQKNFIIVEDRRLFDPLTMRLLREREGNLAVLIRSPQMYVR